MSTSQDWSMYVAYFKASETRYPTCFQSVQLSKGLPGTTLSHFNFGFFQITSAVEQNEETAIVRTGESYDHLSALSILGGTQKFSEVVSPEGKNLRAHPTGMAFFMVSLGQSAIHSDGSSLIMGDGSYVIAVVMTVPPSEERVAFFVSPGPLCRAQHLARVASVSVPPETSMTLGLAVIPRSVTLRARTVWGL